MHVPSTQKCLTYVERQNKNILFSAGVDGAIFAWNLDILFSNDRNEKQQQKDQEKKSEKESSKNSPSSRMSYGRFLDYLEMGWVKQVDLYDNGRNAIIQAASPELGNRPQLIRVEIPVGASQLILKLKEYNIDFDAHPIETKNLFLYVKQRETLDFISVLDNL